MTRRDAETEKEKQKIRERHIHKRYTEGQKQTDSKRDGKDKTEK